MQDSPSLPSATGLYVFAKREGLWDATLAAVQQSKEAAVEGARTLLIAYYQKHLRLPLSEATELVGKVAEIVLQRYAKDFNHVSPVLQVTAAVELGASPAVKQVWEATTQGHALRAGDLSTDGSTISLRGEPIFRVRAGVVQARWSGRPTLSTAAVLNKLARLADVADPRAFYATLGSVRYAGADVERGRWITLKGNPSPKTAGSYPQMITQRGGDPAKVKGALEKAVQALNLAAVSALKFDDRLMKLEQDVYAVFQEYLEFDRMEEAREAQEAAMSQKTSSLSSPDTDSQAGLHDDRDIENGASVTASTPTDEEILQVARIKSLNEARADYTNGRMTQDMFDVFVPLWEALHHHNGPAELQGALDRGDITEHVFQLGQQLLAEKTAKQGA